MRRSLFLVLVFIQEKNLINICFTTTYLEGDNHSISVSVYEVWRQRPKFKEIHTHTLSLCLVRGGEERKTFTMFGLRGIGERIREINYFSLVGYIHLHLGPHFSFLLVLFLLFSVLSNQTS